MGQENFNIELVSNVQFDNDRGNDIWGYVSPDSTEYAIMGTADFTRIFDLSTPENPIEIIAIAGNPGSVHRDIKSFEEYVYVTCDQGQDGLLIVDMRMVEEDSVAFKFWKPEIMGNALSNCHNLYIDEQGYCYLAGCSVSQGRVLVFDLADDPWNPTYLGVVGERYSHDVIVRNNLVYSSEINDGIFSIYDIADLGNVEILGTQETTFSFTHNMWISDDGNYAFTTDERQNAFVESYDVSDPSDIFRLDKFQPHETAGTDVIPHNTHFINGYLVTSWNSDGVIITDVTDPENMVQVGAYDTYLGPVLLSSGCWGVYPWLPSGLIIASDRTSGLFVLQPNYQRAARLKGVVTDLNNNSTINGVDVEFNNIAIVNTSTNSTGDYATGTATAGTYEVQFSHPDYETLTRQVDLVLGETTTLDVQLEPLASGVDAVSLNENITVRPNPFISAPKISFQGKYEKLQIYTLTGELIQSYNLNSNELILENDFKSGMYIAVLSGKENAISVFKLIKT